MQIDYDSRREMILIRLAGRLGSEDFVEALRSVVAKRADFAAGDRLWDLRAASISSISADDIRTAASRIEELPDEVRTARVAVVVSRAADFGVARMYEGMTGHDEGQILVTYDYDRAVAWLATHRDAAH